MSELNTVRHDIVIREMRNKVIAAIEYALQYLHYLAHLSGSTS